MHGLATLKPARICALALAFSAGCALQVFAHEPADPKYGGQIVVAAHLDFEIVARDDGLVLYIEDHSELVSTRGATGTLTAGAAQTEVTVELQPVEPNMLVAKGVTATEGMTVSARLILERPADISMRFKLRADATSNVGSANTAAAPTPFPNAVTFFPSRPR